MQYLTQDVRRDSLIIEGTGLAASRYELPRRD